MKKMNKNGFVCVLLMNHVKLVINKKGGMQYERAANKNRFPVGISACE